MLRFLLFLSLMLTSWPSEAADTAPPPLSKTDVFAEEGDFTHAQANALRYDRRTGGWRLQDDPSGGFVALGQLTLPALRYGAGFTDAVVSWNADCPLGTWLQLEASASRDGGDSWSQWLELARWGDRDTLRFQSGAPGLQQDGEVRVDQDTLVVKPAGDRLRLRVTLHSTRPAVTPLLSLLSVATVNRNKAVDPDGPVRTAWGREVPTQFRAQSWEAADRSYRVCGPTSATMALAAHGIKLPSRQVAAACWDERHGIYGNWPFIAAAMHRLMNSQADGLPHKPGQRFVGRSWVAWPAGWKMLEEEILAGRPSIVSIHFAEGELPGAPTSSSDGHLVLLTGFTKAGDPIVRDPAARRVENGRIVYPRDAFHRARHGGPVILLQPWREHPRETLP
ncbi:MAG: C39 family peptidase [Candidatus Sericytochromatia bacterium]|nr:C39 family peptidase [Candidatus Sericytochromatia bacterium]